MRNYFIADFLERIRASHFLINSLEVVNVEQHILKANLHSFLDDVTGKSEIQTALKSNTPYLVSSYYWEINQIEKTDPMTWIIIVTLRRA